MRYVHTNLIALDWRALASFYERAFGCVRRGPERDLSGEWLAKGTGVPGAALAGAHLSLPGTSATLEIFEWSEPLPRPTPAPQRLGWGHIAFAVDDVPAAVAQVIEHGGEPLGEVVAREVPGAGELTFAYVRDPEGNVIELQRWTEPFVESTTTSVEQGYDRWASSYDEDENATRDLDAIVLRARLGSLAGLDVCELGCGTGKNTEALAAGRSVVALDFSEGMLARARSRVSAAHVRFVRHDLREPLPLEDGCADRVTIDLVLEHIERVEPIFAEVSRILRPGGRAVVIELHPYRQLEGRQARFVEQGVEVKVAAHRHTVSEFVGAALASGLRLDAMSEEGEGLVPRLLCLELSRPERSRE